ncbi:hypothetical protein AB0N14_13680 [Streptomyces sp. NPDC051104]|uniref:hypothetical protein n=1 Tax=Streptomyces sp. NPDC051104 TaxID=3155044 RepID=UPI00343CB8FD
MSTTPLNLDAIEARANAATPGPWMADGHEIYGSGCGVLDIEQWKAETLRIEDPEGAKADAEFMAHARTDVPALAAEIRRLRAELAELRAKTLTTEADEIVLHCPDHSPQDQDGVWMDCHCAVAEDMRQRAAVTAPAAPVAR